VVSRNPGPRNEMTGLKMYRSRVNVNLLFVLIERWDKEWGKVMLLDISLHAPPDNYHKYSPGSGPQITNIKRETHSTISYSSPRSLSGRF